MKEESKEFTFSTRQHADFLWLCFLKGTGVGFWDKGSVQVW